MFIIRWFIRFLMMFVLLVIAGGVFIYVDYKRFLETPITIKPSPMVITVQSGDTITSVIKNFKKHRIVLAEQSPLSQYVGKYYFRYLAKSTQQAQQLKVGDYQLRSGMTAPEILKMLTSGNTIAYKIRFLEGWNFKDMRAEIAKHPNIQHTIDNLSDKEVLQRILEDDSLKGKQLSDYPEGLFFPDTYSFPNNIKDIDLLKIAYRLMQKNIAKAWAARDKDIILKNPYELLIMASLIEQETYLDSERNIISGVFQRRLAKDMLLQTDPTVVYGLGDKYRGKIYKSDLRHDTPYNTYIRKGLPPTPISLPGMASLMAAGQPDKGKSLYFVATGKGGHTFSETYKQHLKAVRAYRKQKNK